MHRWLLLFPVVVFVALGSTARGVPVGPRLEQQSASELRLREASDALAEGNWPRALLMAQSVIPADPSHVGAHGIMGTVFALTNRRREAVASLGIVQSARPAAYHARLIEAILLAQDGKIPAARQALSELAREDRENPLPRFYLASIRFALDELEPARKAFQDLLAAHPRFAPAWTGLGDVARKSDQVEEAIQSYRKALELDPDNVLYRRQLISLYEQSGDTAARDEQIKRLVRRLAGVKELHLQNAMRLLWRGAYAEALKLVEKGFTDYEEFAEGHYIRAACLINLGRPEEAKPDIGNYLRARARSPQAHYYAGMCYLAMESWDRARAEFEELARIMPSFKRGTVNQAVIAQIAGDHDRARELLERSGLAGESPGTYHYLSAHLHLARGDAETYQKQIREAGELLPKIEQVEGLTALPDQPHWELLARERNLMIVLFLNVWNDRAIERCQSILEVHPGDLPALFFQSQALKNQEKMTEALEGLRGLATANPRWTHPWMEMASIHVAMNRAKLAGPAFEKVLELDPPNADAYLGLARCHELEKDFAASVQACLKAVELDPERPGAHFQLAWNYFENLNQPEQALRAIERGMKLDPQNPIALHLKGRILLRSRQIPDAVQSLERAVSLAPGNPTVHYHLGLALYEAKDLQEAKGALEQALRLSRKFPGAERTKELLSEIARKLPAP